VRDARHIYVAAHRIPENVAIAEPAVLGVRRPPVGDVAVRIMDESFEVRLVKVVKRCSDDGVIVIDAVGFLTRIVQGWQGLGQKFSSWCTLLSGREANLLRADTQRNIRLQHET